jgi:nucleoside-diphosphate-sugar epimerase
MRKILVTGANGFLGYNCLNVLQNYEFEIYALDKFFPQNTNSKINWIEADLCNTKQIDQVFDHFKPEYLLHLAWNMETGMQLNSRIHYPWVEISMNLVKRFARAGGKRIIVSGSCAEYQWGNYYYGEETTPLKPESIYGICKHQLHQNVAEFCLKNNLSYTWGRIFFMYGPNENRNRLVPYIIHSILNENKVLTTSGNQTYDYLYVEDVANALIRLIESDFIGPVNICSGQPLQVKELILKIANSMNANHLIDLGARETEKNAPQFVVGKNDRLKTITGWQQNFDIEKGIEKTIQSIVNKNDSKWGK